MTAKIDDTVSVAIADKEIVGPWVSGFANVKSVLFYAKVDYGSGGESLVVHLQTSLDGGKTAIGIAALKFAKASQTKVVNLSSVSPRGPFVPREKLPAEGIEDGVIGDMLRTVITPTGKFENTAVTAGIVTR